MEHLNFWTACKSLRGVIQIVINFSMFITVCDI